MHPDPASSALPGDGSRSAALDAVRLLAVVAVVVGHVTVDPTLVALTYGWHVPVFFVVTGRLWVPGRSLRAEVRRRAATLLRPYLFWLAVVGTAGLALSAARGQSRTGLLGQARDALLGGAYAGRPLTAFWFVTALFVAVLLWRAVERLPVALRVGVAAGGVALSTAAGPGLARVPLAAGTALACLVFLGAGQLLQARPLRPAAGVALVAAGAGLLSTGAVEPLFLKGGLVGTPAASVLTAAAIGAGLVPVAEALVPRTPRTVQRAVLAAAPALLVVVLVHALVLDLLLPPAGPLLPVPLVAVLAVALPLALGLALRRTRLAGWATGRP